MNQNFKLTKDQQTLVEKNLSIVHWVIVNNIHVNPGICGLEYGDLFQEGCLWLCKAAFTYHAGQAQFSTYAKKVVKNGLLSYCRKICSQGQHISRRIKFLFGHRHSPVKNKAGLMKQSGLVQMKRNDVPAAMENRLGTNAHLPVYLSSI
jgi:DNA-directed RNA polymerase specialized sigma subunit